MNAAWLHTISSIFSALTAYYIDYVKVHPSAREN